MTLTNPYFVIALLAVVLSFKLDLIARLLNMGAFREEPPEALRDLIDSEKHTKTREYLAETNRFEILQAAFSLAVLILFWLCGGFGFLDEWARSLGHGPVTTGLLVIGLLAFAGNILGLPWQAYHTFVLEEKYGFNRTTLATFISDHFKGLFLAIVIGAPLLALILYLFETFEHAWVYVWISVTLISLLLAYLGPRLIFPLFHKFSPLEDGELKTRIHELARECDFPVGEISVIDGSRRSSKANAFFTGFGKTKRIALFDTLIENHTEDEIVAVLAHEIGHFKRGHVVQNIAVSVVHQGVLFFLLGLFLKNPMLFAAFGVPQTSVYLSLVFFGLLYQPISVALSVALKAMSRRHEFQADAYAAESTGSADDLASALKKLSVEHLSHPTPHPLYVSLNYSHPPLLQRLAALGKV